MRKLLIPLCVFGCLLLPAPVDAAEKNVDLPALVEQLQDYSAPAASSEAFMQLCETLRTASPEIVASVQTKLLHALQISNDAWAVRRMAVVLSTAPCEEAVFVLASRLHPDQPQAMAMSLCDGLRAVAERQPELSRSTLGLALERLDALASDPRLPGATVQSAVMAIAAFGSSGFDLLMKLKSQGTPAGKIHSVIFTAISETDDSRAFAVLREAIQDPASFDSRRAQAIYGLGQMFSRAASAGRSIDPAERNACVSLLAAHLNDALPDRIFVSALKAAGRIEEFQRDVRLRQVMTQALRSASPVRREAALEVLFQHQDSMDPYVSGMVRELAASDSSPEVRSAAATVLDREQASQIEVPLVGQQ